MADLRELQDRKERAIWRLNSVIVTLKLVEHDLEPTRDFLHDGARDELSGSRAKLVNLRDTLERDLRGDRKALWERKGRRHQ